MCSEGVSVWFACKLCNSFFLNADDFAYHKKKSHFQEFRKTKFIVFEEKDSVTASPPENWVSFLSPKEETRIHKIISSPMSSTLTTVDCGDSVTENIQSNRNKEFIQIDPERNKDVKYIDDDNQDTDDAKDQVSNNIFELNCYSNSNNDDTDKSLISHEKDPLKLAIDVASTDCNLTNQTRDEPTIKSTLKRPATLSRISRRKIENPSSVSRNILQPVVQPPPNPCVQLKRLNMKTIQNASPHSSCAVYATENGTNHRNSGAKSGNEPQAQETDAEQEKMNQSCCSTSISPPQTMRKRGTGLKNCKFCLKHFNSTAVLDIHEDTCRLKSKRKFQNIHCVHCLLKFGSSDELNAHNSTFHSKLIPTPSPKITNTGHQTELIADDFEVEAGSKIEVQSHFLSSVCNQSSVNELPLYINDSNPNNTDVNPDLDLDPFSNTTANYNDDIDVDVSETKFANVAQDNLRNIPVFQDHFSTSESILPDNECNNQNANEINHQSDFVFNSNTIPDPTSEIAKCNLGRILEVVKTEFVADGNEYEDREFSYEDHDPLKSESQMELLSEEGALNVTDSASNTARANETQAPQTQTRFFCISCKIPFSHMTPFSIHNKKYHLTQEGKKDFKCPHPNCGKTFNNHWHLKRHFRHVHCNAKPWKCPYLNCKKAFKTSIGRNDHLKFHTANDFKGKFECPFPNCGKTSNEQCDLRNHIRQVHSHVRPFKCPYPNCTQSFKVSSSRNRHFKGHTKNSVESSGSVFLFNDIYDG